jgi:hypothetical protein
MDDNGNNHHTNAGGRWESEGGRLRWVAARDLAENAGDVDDATGRDLDELDEASWASDVPPLPPGAPESARVRAALAWLRRVRDTEGEIVGELGLIERDQLRAQDAAPPPRRARGTPTPNPITVQMAEHGAAAEWFEAAREALEDAAERNPGRALVEWYLWIAADAAPAAMPGDELAQARARGAADAQWRAQRHAEHLALPEAADEE